MRTLGLSADAEGKYRLADKWDGYLAYQPLEPDCSRAELDAFAALEDEAACGMCPANERQFELPLPLRLPKPRTGTAAQP